MHACQLGFEGLADTAGVMVMEEFDKEAGADLPIDGRMDGLGDGLGDRCSDGSVDTFVGLAAGFAFVKAVDVSDDGFHGWIIG